MEDLFLTIFWLPSSFVILFTGDLVLLILSFGKHKPICFRLNEKANIRSDILSEATFWVGVLAWLGALIFVGKFI
jgi:hypothetical protein